MPVKLFILGRPGSGKSAAFRYCKRFIENKYGWIAVHYNDYEILQCMYQYERLFPDENKPEQFCATKYGGFDVIDFSVLDKALKELEKRVRARYSKKEKDELIVIEFARNDYGKALSLFSSDFLSDAYFLFLDTGLETCIHRVQERADHPTYGDDLFVSEDILRSYYGNQILPSNFAISQRNIKVLHNNGSYAEFLSKLDRFIDTIMAKEFVIEDDKKNAYTGESKLSSSESIGDYDPKIVQRNLFHFPPLSTRMLVSFFSFPHQKVK